MTLEQIEQRLAAIRQELDTRGHELTQDALTALTTEVNDLLVKRSTLTTTAQQRQAILDSIAQGSTGQVTRSFPPQAAPTPSPTPPQAQPEQRDIDHHDTTEYRNAFMEYVCRGRAIPMELRDAATTMTTDASAVIPTTILQEIIKQMDSHGEIYAKARKLNIQGGVAVPILTLKPEAKWIGEGKSDDQKIAADDNVTFSYHGLECKIAQSLLANIVTYDIFKREFVQLATEAIIKALEIGMFTADGQGKMLGILKDKRVPAANVITLAAEDMTWEGWKKKVFAKMKKAYRTGEFIMAQGTFDGYIDGMVDVNGQPIGRITYGIEGEEKYRFGGKTVLTVEDDCIKGYEDAAAGEVIAVFMDLSNYAINSNMQLTVTSWTDHDNNTIKNKCTMICDGKLLDANGVLIIKKG